MAWADAPAPAEQRLGELVEEALHWHPSVKAARREVAAARARRGGVPGFYDPRLLAEAGAARRHRGIPGATAGYTLMDNSYSASGGVERAFGPGFYGSVGAAHRYLLDNDGNQQYVQDLVGAQVRIPLLRDRGFRLNDLETEKALADYLAAESRLLAARQNIRHSVTIAFITAHESYQVYRISLDAEARVQVLFKEAQGLVRLKSVPEYQLHQAQLEVMLSEERSRAAQETLDQALVELTNLVGHPVPVADEWSADLVGWAQGSEANLELAIAAAVQSRGTWLDLQYQRQAVESELALATERRKGDLSLRTGVTWQGEADRDTFGDSTRVSDDHVGGYVELVYSRPWGLTTERAQVSEQEARLAAIGERLRQEVITAKTALTKARLQIESSRQRLAMATAAVDMAQRTLDAEGERFRLGESRSRQVLDAQADLTNTIRLQTQNAAHFLRALADYRYHAGYLPLEVAADDVQQGEPTP